MSKLFLTRRQAVAGYGALLAAARSAHGQKLIGEPPDRIAPVQELINLHEVEAMAQRKLDSVTFEEIAGSERGAFERITFRPRLMIDTTKLDLSTELFGQSLFTPIMVGPVSEQKRFHPEGELAMVRGASAAKALVVVADHSSYPFDEIAAQAKTALWYQVYPESDVSKAHGRVQQAVKAGYKAICMTLGAADGFAGVDWASLDRLRQGITAPVLLKGILSPEEAQKAVGLGVQGIIVSNYAPRSITGLASPIEMLPSIVDAVGGKIPVLIDGSFRRGSDVVKALALGARAVLLGRPPVWGLAAYGAEGVQKVVELLQTEVARDMAMCGKINIKSLDRSVVRIHRR
jgi:isopentenyl diphosphate isomerase/L-lactate dehydrogenase-like FMN-dependent dehydrogenase